MVQCHISIDIVERILTSPYEDRDGWDLNAMYVNGTLYLEEHLSDERLGEKWVRETNSELRLTCLFP